MAKPRNKLEDWLAYLGLRLLAMVLYMFSPRANYRTVRWLGRMLFRFDRRHRDIALRHLRLSFPDWTEDRCRRVARQSMEAMACLALEVLLTPRLLTPARWRRHCRMINQAENIRLLTRRPHGLIYVTGHFGNWEVLGYLLGALGFDGFAVARPLDNPYLNRYLMDLRQAVGLRILDKAGASALMDEILTAKDYVGFIADQDAGRKGLFVDFFGRPASTYKAPALMAIRHNVPVIVGYGLRCGEDFSFDLGIHRIIRPEEWADKDDPVRWITQEYTAALEELVRARPEQYLWMHRRWKHRPRGQPQPADGVA